MSRGKKKIARKLKLANSSQVDKSIGKSRTKAKQELRQMERVNKLMYKAHLPKLAYIPNILKERAKQRRGKKLVSIVGKHKKLPKEVIKGIASFL